VQKAKIWRYKIIYVVHYNFEISKKEILENGYVWLVYTVEK